VLTPTRELAMQVTTAATTYGKHLRRLRTSASSAAWPTASS
jgi:superfamily II DNA/RNA helicase